MAGPRRRNPDEPASASRGRPDAGARAGSAGRIARGALAGIRDSWRTLRLEQRVAAVAATLVIVSTLGPFSFVEAAEILTAGAVLALLHTRAQRREFHLPLADGTAIAAAGVWCALLIVARMFDRPPGQTALALLCAAVLAGAGMRERARRAPDDLTDADGAGGVVARPARGEPGPARAAPPRPSGPPPGVRGDQTSETGRGPGPT